MDIKIDKGIPVPTAQHPGRPKGSLGRGYVYPWADRKVGDSFLVDIPISGMTEHKRRAEKKYGFKFTCRTVPNGTRTWRITKARGAPV